MSSVFNDTFFKSLDSSVKPIGQAETLPPECYTDPDFYEFEKEALFNHEWLCMGRQEWIAKPGDYFTASVIGEPLLIARTRSGEIKAMSAVCQHRAMLVAEGQGNTQAFLCPYHHWSYGLDGELIGAPAMDKTEGFNKRDFCLPTLKVEVWQGFIFVNFDPDAPALAPRLTALDGVLANYRLTEAEGPRAEPGTPYAWNWKVMMENNNDGYHANRLHGGPLHDFVPSARAQFPELPADTAGYYRTNGSLHQDASFNATQRAIQPVFPHLSTEERNRLVFANVPPTLSLVMTSDMVMYLILHATGPSSLVMQQGMLFAPGAMKDPKFPGLVALTETTATQITDQDWHVDQLVQEGLQSRFAIRGRYSWQEQAQRDFNGWAVPRYQAAWERMDRQAPRRTRTIQVDRGC